jgi:hypothetical protein
MTSRRRMILGGLAAWSTLGAALALAAYLWRDDLAPTYVWSLGNWALLYAAIPQTVFLVAYSRAPWFRTAIGRSLMIKGLALALILDWAFVSRVFGVTFPFAEETRALLFLGVAAGATYQCWVVISTQWRTTLAHHSHGDQLAQRDAHNADPHGLH